MFYGYDNLFKCLVGSHILSYSQQQQCRKGEAAHPRNNHIETVLIKSLLGPLALASYWITLTYLTHLHYFIMRLMAYQQGFSMSVSGGSSMASL